MTENYKESYDKWFYPWITRSPKCPHAERHPGRGALYKLMLRVAKKGVWMEPPTWDLQSSCKIQTCGTEA
ncbi:hypothetical protein TrVFT333_001508 [Trichoderma virens FT-333]|nr:hypothetical protein TrVFT333_001508 [Trichoderma virens FT-333]